MDKPIQQRVLVDLDGTLALTDHRKHYVQGIGKKDWRAFFAACVDDSPNTPVIQVVRMLSISYPVTIVSGRSAEVMEQSINWLHQYGIPYTDIIMRPEGDFTPDHELKARWCEEMDWNAETVLCVLDDRDAVVEMWRKRGMSCLQVAEGKF